MNSPEILYQWQEAIDKVFGHLGAWQRKGLAQWTVAIAQAESCRLGAVAEAVSGGRRVECQERRFQRWLDNERIELTRVFADWIRWVGELWRERAMLVLVDETKLANRVRVMVVSAYYAGNAIPLIWRAYAPDDYPPEGQVALMTDLLAQVRAALPVRLEVLLLADRGLGTSPEWQDRLTALGWPYLLRVQQSTQLCLPHGKAHPLRHLVAPGQSWIGHARVFKKAGWRRLYVYLWWEPGYAQPWCLVSNCPDLFPCLYAQRFAHEVSFRDLKSDGFDWHASRVWQPAHVERLLLPLTLALFWALTMGTIVWHVHPLTARQKRKSLFRLGLDELFARFRLSKPFPLEFYLVPLTPLFRSVVQ